MDAVRQNPIQRTVRTAHLSVLMTVHNFSTQYSTEQFWLSPLLPPDNHHSSDVVYQRKWNSTDELSRLSSWSAADTLTSHQQQKCTWNWLALSLHPIGGLHPYTWSSSTWTISGSASVWHIIRTVRHTSGQWQQEAHETNLLLCYIHCYTMHHSVSHRQWIEYRQSSITVSVTGSG